MSVTAHETTKSDAERDRASKTRRFFASELPWFLIFMWFCWTFALGPALTSARYSMHVGVLIRNTTSAEVHVVTTFPRERHFSQVRLEPGESQRVGVAFGGDDTMWTSPVSISVYTTDWRLLKRWEGPAEDFAPNGPNPHELIIDDGGDGEAAP